MYTTHMYFIHPQIYRSQCVLLERHNATQQAYIENAFYKLFFWENVGTLARQLDSQTTCSKIVKLLLVYTLVEYGLETLEEQMG